MRSPETNNLHLAHDHLLSLINAAKQEIDNHREGLTEATATEVLDRLKTLLTVNAHPMKYTAINRAHSWSFSPINANDYSYDV